MVNYSNGKIYKIVCNITGLIYIGSTCKKLCQRISQHRTAYKRYLKDNKHYITSFKIIEGGNYEIILIETFPCENKEELHKRERYFIDTLECANKVIPTRTEKEYNKYYKETHKLEILEKERKNKAYRNAITKSYYERSKLKPINKLCCNCGGQYTHRTKARHFKTQKHIKFLNSLESKNELDIKTGFELGDLKYEGKAEKLEIIHINKIIGEFKI